jgi:hypothetical protein
MRRDASSEAPVAGSKRAAAVVVAAGTAAIAAAGVTRGVTVFKICGAAVVWGSHGSRPNMRCTHWGWKHGARERNVVGKAAEVACQSKVQSLFPASSYRLAMCRPQRSRPPLRTAPREPSAATL